MFRAPERAWAASPRQRRRRRSAAARRTLHPARVPSREAALRSRGRGRRGGRPALRRRRRHCHRFGPLTVRLAARRSGTALAPGTSRGCAAAARRRARRLGAPSQPLQSPQRKPPCRFWSYHWYSSRLALLRRRTPAALRRRRRSVRTGSCRRGHRGKRAQPRGGAGNTGGAWFRRRKDVVRKAPHAREWKSRARIGQGREPAVALTRSPPRRAGRGRRRPRRSPSPFASFASSSAAAAPLPAPRACPQPHYRRV